MNLKPQHKKMLILAVSIVVGHIVLSTPMVKAFTMRIPFVGKYL